jgi:hypothetical protein
MSKPIIARFVRFTAPGYDPNQFPYFSGMISRETKAGMFITNTKNHKGRPWDFGRKRGEHGVFATFISDANMDEQILKVTHVKIK